MLVGISVLVSTFMSLFIVCAVIAVYKRNGIIFGSINTFRLMMMLYLINTSVSLNWWFFVYICYIVWELKDANAPKSVNLCSLIEKGARIVMDIIAVIGFIALLGDYDFSHLQLIFHSSVDFWLLADILAA